MAVVLGITGIYPFAQVRNCWARTTILVHICSITTKFSTSGPKTRLHDSKI